MSTSIPTQIRIDAEVKEQANSLFKNLGTDMSGAVNMFLRQCVLRGGLPFNVELPKFTQDTEAAMAEAKKLAKDKNAKTYYSLEEYHKALGI